MIIVSRWLSQHGIAVVNGFCIDRPFWRSLKTKRLQCISASGLQINTFSPPVFFIFAYFVRIIRIRKTILIGVAFAFCNFSSLIYTTFLWFVQSPVRVCARPCMRVYVCWWKCFFVVSQLKAKFDRSMSA